MRLTDPRKNFSYILKQIVGGLRGLGFQYILLLSLILVNYLVTYIKSRKFVFRGNTYHYFYHPYNHTWANERCIEIPIVSKEIKEAKGKDILEIGNVLQHYIQTNHDVVDKYEKAPGVINEDAAAFNLKKKYDLIVSVSTMEHVGWGEQPKDPKKFLGAVENLKKHLKRGGKIIMTFPLGYNPYLDKWIEKKTFFQTAYFLKRYIFNRWKEVSWKEIKGANYTEYTAGKSLVVIVIEK